MVGVDDLRLLRDAYLAEWPTYERFAKHVEERLATVMRRLGVRCRVESRAKDPASLLKKAIRNSYSNPLVDVTDKAAARIIVASPDSLALAEEGIRDSFSVQWREDKRESLAPTELGYLGIHFGVKVLAGDERAVAEFGERECEVQLNTAAQRAWADVSHELLYKPVADPDPRVSRILYRLMALMEIFDESVTVARETLSGMAGWKTGAVLAGLEREFLSMAAHDYDRELSLLVLTAILPAYGDDRPEAIGDTIHRFIGDHSEKLQRLFRDYEDDPRHVMLYQPESFAVFERLEADPFVLRDQWQTVLPVELLEDLSAVWGVAL